MKEPTAFFVISEYKNDISWVENYTHKYIIYDKSNTLPAGPKILKVENRGYNIWDMLDFIIRNYNNLPSITAFLEGFPYDHCRKETFDKLIYNETFTPIEDYSHYAEYYAHKKDIDGGYMEINSSWYLEDKNPPQKVHRYYSSYNEFLADVFINPEFPQWIRFSPGAQYLVPKENILFYSKKFYEKLIRLVDYAELPTEAHLLERAMYTIFTNKFKEKL
jgi:hypothetical protein